MIDGYWSLSRLIATNHPTIWRWSNGRWVRVAVIDLWSDWEWIG